MTMTDLPKLIILDVAHGNCSILQDTEGTIIIDCAHGDTLIEALRHLEISAIDRIMISHADQDHFKGFIDLLSDESITVKHVHLNPDIKKDTQAFQALRRAIGEANERNNIIHESLHTNMTGTLDVGEVRVEILSPSINIMGYAGGKDLQGRSLTSNSVSAVIRLVYKSRGVALLAGDIDQVGLDNLLTNRSEIKSDILVFPHHGGNAGAVKGTENHEFTIKLCEQVKPNLVIFSTGRNKQPPNPREEIVKTLIDTLPDVHIMCTQLAKTCAPEVLVLASTHLNKLPSKGREANHCCGGTVVINFSETDTTYIPSRGHRQFVNNNVSLALCKSPIFSEGDKPSD
jgi:beta-lactamase superfamily II metal-dependent hydrolase